MKLYHFTCRHSASRIDADGYLRPNLQAPVPVLWLTDMKYPHRTGLGLTSRILDCDRTEVRYSVEWDAITWTEYRDQVEPELVVALERHPSARPDRWYVTPEAVPVSA